MIIPLTQGQVAIADDADAEILAGYKWCAHRNESRWYAYTSLRGQRRTETMHRILLPGVRQIDHWNGNGLDNRRENLRPATTSQNAVNRAKYAKHSTSRYKGVYFNQGRWVALVKHQGRNIHLGRFREEAEAAHAYNEKAVETWGSFARLNIIIAGPSC